MFSMALPFLLPIFGDILNNLDKNSSNQGSGNFLNNNHALISAISNVTNPVSVPSIRSFIDANSTLLPNSQNWQTWMGPGFYL